MAEADILELTPGAVEPHAVTANAQVRRIEYQRGRLRAGTGPPVIVPAHARSSADSAERNWRESSFFWLVGGVDGLALGRGRCFATLAT
jgi:hypothetical protein